MKYLMFLSILAITYPRGAIAQTFSDQKAIQFSLDKIDMVHVHNHKGEVSVKGTNLTEGRIMVTRTLKSASKSTLEQGKEKIYLDSIINEGKIYFFIQAPDHMFKVDENGQGYYHSKWNTWDGDKKNRFDVDFEFTITVELPKTTSINVSTHEKNLTISDLTGQVMASNHHDNVSLVGMQNDVDAHSHHGDVTVEFAKNPSTSVRCHTHHGEIKISLQSPLSADVSMKSHHGSFYTDFHYEVVAMQVSKKQDSRRGTKYEIGDGTNVRIGQGGLKMDFGTHHGDVYIMASDN